MGGRGVISAGTWCVDHNLTIDHWPEQETVARLLASEAEGGGCGYNFGVALARLGFDAPIHGIGAIGDDANGTLLRERAATYGIDATRLKTLPGSTSYTLSLAPEATGKRTHIFNPGVGADLRAKDFPLDVPEAGFLHIGLPGIHPGMDAPNGQDANGWVTVLRQARAKGLKTNLELVSVEPEKIAATGRPCLPHLSYLVVNDLEIGALAGLTTVDAGATNVPKVVEAVASVMDAGAMDLIAVHFPEGVIALTRSGSQMVVPSVAVPADAVVGTNGAGDAFTAGLMFALFQERSLEDALRLGHATAASSVRASTTIGAITTATEALDLADRWGWRTTLEL